MVGKLVRLLLLTSTLGLFADSVIAVLTPPTAKASFPPCYLGMYITCQPGGYICGCATVQDQPNNQCVWCTI